MPQRGLCSSLLFCPLALLRMSAERVKKYFFCSYQQKIVSKNLMNRSPTSRTSAANPEVGLLLSAQRYCESIDSPNSKEFKGQKSDFCLVLSGTLNRSIPQIPRNSKDRSPTSRTLVANSEVGLLLSAQR
jgi:hypothetical protein